MGTILKIALRNLIQHRAKTLIIGSLIAVAIALGLVGNTVLDSAQRSLKKTFTSNFTGDILILPATIQGGIFGASSGESNNMSGPPILPMMKDYEKVAALVKGVDGIAHSTSQISAYVIYNFQDDGINWGLTFGIEPADYFATFDNIVLLKGRRLQAGETGILIHEKTLESFQKDNGVTLKVGDSLQLNNFGESGFKIREVPIVGVFRFQAGNERAIAFMQPSFVDVNTLRALKGKAILTAEDVKLNPTTQAALDVSADNFFADDTVSKAKTVHSPAVDLERPLGKTITRVDRATTDHGAWNYILLRLKPGVSEDAVVADLNGRFKKAGLEVKAQTWFPSAQPDSGVFWAMSLVFNIVIWLIAIVSVIIIMNTLVAAVMERTPEIGTMRALGAQKGFIRGMFIMETLTITAVFGVAGILIGFLLILLLNLTGISAPNDFMKLIFGGPVLRPDVTLNQISTALAIIVFIAIVSWLLPVRMALKVSPLKAINSD